MSNDQTAPAPTPQPTPPAGDPPKAPAPVPTPPAPKAGDPPPADPAKKADEPLGEAGLKALQAERDARQALEKRLKTLEPLEKLADALGQGDGKGKKSDVEELTERLTTHEKQLAEERAARWRAEIAHEKGLTPQQAERLQGSTREELGKDADALLVLFPTAADPNAGKKFAGGADGGARGGSTAPAQLTRQDLKGMTAEQIVKAKNDGQLKDLLGST